MIIVTGFSNKKVGALKYQQLAFMPNNSIRGAVYREELREEWVDDTQPAQLALLAVANNASLGE